MSDDKSKSNWTIPRDWAEGRPAPLLGETETLTLTGFLLARIEEDEAVVAYFGEVWFPPNLPARFLAECAAKRRIVEQVSETAWAGYAVRDVILGHLAAPYADHPEFRPEWAL